MTEVFMSRQPLVNRQSRIIATRLLLHLTSEGGMPAAVMALDSLASVWPTGGKPLFVSCQAATIDARILDWSAPENATIELPAACLLGEHGPDLIAAIQIWQPTICLHFDPQAAQALALGLPYRFIGFDTGCLNSTQLKLLAARTRSYGMGIAFKVPTTADFRASMDAGMTAAAGWFFTTPSGIPAKTLSASQAHIVRLLTLVRSNAEIREIEAALKQDVAISYRLLPLHQFGWLRLVLRNPVVSPCGDHARLRKAQSLAIAAARHGQQGSDGTGADAHGSGQSSSDRIAGHRSGRQVGVRQPVHHRRILAA